MLAPQRPFLHPLHDPALVAPQPTVRIVVFMKHQMPTTACRSSFLFPCNLHIDCPIPVQTKSCCTNRHVHPYPISEGHHPLLELMSLLDPPDWQSLQSLDYSYLALVGKEPTKGYLHSHRAPTRSCEWPCTMQTGSPVF